MTIMPAKQKNLIAYCNGRFIDENEPCITLKDRGFLFGDGVFTTIKVVNGNVEYYPQHLERLKSHCQAINIEFPKISLDDINVMIEKNNAQRGAWKLKVIITGGDLEDLALPFRKCGKLLMIMKPIASGQKEKIKLTHFPFPIFCPTSKIKTLGYLNRFFVAEYAKAQGFDEAVVFSENGYMTETAFSNLFWLVDRDFFTPDPELNFLMGIELNEQIKRYKKNGYNIHFVKEKFENIPSHAKIYICNCIKGVVSVEL